MILKHCLFAGLLLLPTACSTGHAQVPPQKTEQRTAGVEPQILELEKKWNEAIQRQDVAAMPGFLSEEYFLAGGFQGGTLMIVPRAAWLENLKVYETKSFTIDDAKVHAYGGTAVVTLLFSQQATFRGHDVSGQYFLTDVWVNGKDGWRVAERHSSRPAPAPAPVAPRP
jgi:ketosteroid isomerase-like protein